MNLSIMCNTLGENQSVSDLALQIIYMCWCVIRLVSLQHHLPI